MVSVRFSGEYESVGNWSLMVMLIVAEEEPPELLAQIVYVIGLVCRTVGIPQTVALLVLKVRPVGKAGVISQEVMAPGPVKVGASGK